MQVGDKIVCIENGKYNKELELYKTYIIKEINLFNSIPYVAFDEHGFKYTLSRFIPLSDFRRMQILKIKERINENLLCSQEVDKKTLSRIN